MGNLKEVTTLNYQGHPYEEESGYWQEDKNAYVERRYARLVRYKGGSSTTVTNSYTPSEGEKQLAQASADYAKKVAPNAYYLNDLGRSLLQDSLGAVQVDFNSLNKQAQQQAANATKGMSGLIGSNNAATAAANGTLGNLSGQMGELTGQNVARVGTLGDLYKAGAVGANSALGAVGQKMGDMTAQNANRLGSLAGIYQESAKAANGTLANASNSTGTLARQTATRMGGLAGAYQGGTEAANSMLGDTSKLLEMQDASVVLQVFIKAGHRVPIAHLARQAVRSASRRMQQTIRSGLLREGSFHSSIKRIWRTVFVLQFKTRWASLFQISATVAS